MCPALSPIPGEGTALYFALGHALQPPPSPLEIHKYVQPSADTLGSDTQAQLVNATSFTRTQISNDLHSGDDSGKFLG